MNVAKLHAAIANRLGHIQYKLLQQLTTPGEPMVNGCKSFSITRSTPDYTPDFENIVEVVTERPAGKRRLNYTVKASEGHGLPAARYYPDSVIVVIKTEVLFEHTETRTFAINSAAGAHAVLQIFEDFLLRGDVETHRALATMFEVKTAEGTTLTNIHEGSGVVCAVATEPTPPARMETVLRKVLNQILQESPQDSENPKVKVSIQKLSGKPAPYALNVKHGRVKHSVIATLVSEDEHSYLLRYRFLAIHLDSPGVADVDVECEYRFIPHDDLSTEQEAGLALEVRRFLLEHKLPQGAKPTTP